MSKKKNAPKTPAADLPALRIGSRVRCTDDGVEGRITWANAVSVKVEWADGEKVTWRRDSLPTRPIEIIDADDENRPGDPSHAALPDAGTATSGHPAPTDPAVYAADIAAEEAAEAGRHAEVSAAPAAAPADGSPEAPTAQAIAPDGATPGHDAAAAPDSTAPDAPAHKAKKAAGAAKEKRVSALDAAARVLAEEGKAMTCQEMIEAMAAKGYWTSPGGKTPAATLYSAILRELGNKGGASRFVKTERGKFAAKS
jgi:hypothetical protein